jgi:hypothetical protein
MYYTMSDFVKGFDCKNETHIMWLKEVGRVMAQTTDGKRVDIIGTVNGNPIQGSPQMKNVMDWAYVHFQLTMKYANAVLNGQAFVPTGK